MKIQTILSIMILLTMPLYVSCQATGTPSPTQPPALENTPAEEIPTQAPAAKVSLTTEKDTLNVGETTQVIVTIEDINGLYGADLRLNFTPDTLKTVDSDDEEKGVQIAAGELLAADVIAQNQADATTGSIIYAACQLAPHEAVSGSGTLATITFQGKAAGPGTITLSQILLATVDGEEIPATIQTESITLSVN